MKKFLALMISLLMILGACSAMAADAPADAPVIHIYANSGAGTGSGSEAGSTQAGYDMVQQYIYEQTGVWVEAQLAPASNSTEKLNTMLAGGEPIDLFWGNWQNYYDTGIIQTWNEFVKEWPLIWDTWDAWDAWGSVTDSEGNIWGMPRMTPTTPYQVFFRMQWLDDLGIEMPSTFDELNAYLYAVKEADPAGNGNTIPLLCNRLDRLQYCFLGGFVKGGNGMWIDEADGKVKPVYLAEGYTDFLKQMAQWYADGIIAQEAFSWDTATLRSYVVKAVAGATATWYSDITTRDELTTQTLLEADSGYSLEKYPYAYYINENGIKGANDNWIETRSNAGNTALMMNVNCKEPEAALKFISWQYEGWENYYTTVWGLKDYHWQYNPDDPDAETVTFATTGWTDADGTAMYKTVDGDLSYDNTIAYFANFTTSIGLPTEVLGASYLFGRQQQHSLWLQSHLDDFDVTNEPGVEYGIVWNSTELLDNVPNYTDVSTYANEQLLKFVIGERDIDAEWSAFIDELYKIGQQDVIDEYTRQYGELTK